VKEIGNPRAVDGTWSRHAWRLAALWVLVLAAYSNSFQAGLVFDSANVIAGDPRIREARARNAQLILSEEYWYGRAKSGLYRPITTLSYLINYATFGNGVRPAGYHWVNLALHSANVGLVYALGILIFEDTALAWALAALWGLHPLLTESVTNIVGRADLLAGCGVLSGLLCYVKSAAATGRRKAAWLAALAAAQTMALFSKESGAVLPGIMLLYDLTWPRLTKWRARWPGYAALALPFAVFLYLRGAAPTSMAIDFSENPLVSAGFWAARLTALKVIGKFLWLFLWPARLTADYSYNAIPVGWKLDWDDAAPLLAIACCLGAVAAAFRWKPNEGKLKHALPFFLLFFLVALAPVSNLIVLIGSIMAERFVYLPAVGLAGCLAVAIRALTGRLQWIAVGLLCLAFGARTYARNFDWRDELSLWTSAEKAYPASARPHNNLGNALARVPGRLQDAVAEYHAALRIKPDDPITHYNLGNALAKMPERLPDAIAEYRAALRSDPSYTDAHINLGNALVLQPGGLSDAAAEYETALRLEPGSAYAHYNLGNLFAGVPGKLADAIGEYRAALAVNPAMVEAHNHLGDALSQMPGRLPDAVAEYQAALRLEPGSAEAHYGLGNLLATVPGKLADAIAEYRAALAIDPGNAKVHSNLGSCLSQMPGRLPEAIAEYQAALRIEPGNAEAHYNLGNALAEMPGRTADAMAEFEAAIRSQPGFADAHFNLGKLLARTPGRIPDAIAEFEAAVRIAHDPEAQQMLNQLRAGRR
jgi:protein O-mannosyl-transferase